MDAELKAKAIEALRSGKYKQGRHALRCIGNRYCCLGVIYEVAGGEWYHEGMTSEGRMTVIPTTLVERGVQSKLIRLNDEERKSFPDIADYIEANL